MPYNKSHGVYGDYDEYRLEKLTSTQGHYTLAKNLKLAMKKAKFRASNSGVPWTVQIWKPKRGKQVYIILPNSMAGTTKKELITYFKIKGYDISHINKKNFVISKRSLLGSANEKKRRK